MPSNPSIIVALDFATTDEAIAVARRLDPAGCRVKVGKELFIAGGPGLVGRLRELGYDVFVDLKFHDIPNTVAAACRAAAAGGAWMVDVHASGGRRMMSAAREALEESNPRPLLVAVTVLTSLAPADLAEIGWTGTPREQVARLAGLAAAAGMDGVVCSPHEAAPLRAAHGPAFLLVTPGVRPAGASRDDQQRTATPRAALAAGASHLVIGRPITRAADPGAALAAIRAEMELP